MISLRWPTNLNRHEPHAYLKDTQARLPTQKASRSTNSSSKLAGNRLSLDMR